MSKIVFNENDLTIGDLEDFEDAVGLTIQEALKEVPVKDAEGKVMRHNCADDPDCVEPCGNNGRPMTTVDLSAKTLKGLVWIVKRQTEPDFTLADARKVKVTELDIVRAGADDPEDSPKE